MGEVKWDEKQIKKVKIYHVAGYMEIEAENEEEARESFTKEVGFEDTEIEEVEEREIELVAVYNKCSRCERTVKVFEETWHAKRLAETTIAVCNECEEGSGWQLVE